LLELRKQYGSALRDGRYYFIAKRKGKLRRKDGNTRLMNRLIEMGKTQKKREFKKSHLDETNKC
jgi:hypothetical protein